MVFRNMAFAVGALYLPAALAATGPLTKTVFERRLQDEEVTAHFDANRERGRAWIAVEVIPFSQGDGAQEPEVFPRAVDGLYYDQASKQVIYRNGSSRIVCAEDSTFLWTVSLKETGQCRLRVSSETLKLDDGFDGREEIVGKVALEVR